MFYWRNGSYLFSSENIGMNEEKPEVKSPKKFHNGWTDELEVLVADWTDRAQCYRWMHDKSSQDLARFNQYMMIPVIILSTLSGTANFGLDTIFPDPTSYNKKIATLGIGSISIITGIISTLANFFRYAQLSESHSVAAISWAKFARLITIELALHPNERTDAFAFLKMFRIELDRLIEQSPAIPEFIVQRFQKEFVTKVDIKRPDITGDIEHTAAYSDRTERLKVVAAEAALSLMHKKKLLKDLVMTDIDKRIHQIVDAKPYVVAQRKASIQSNFPKTYVPVSAKEEIQQIKQGYVGDLKRAFANRQPILPKEKTEHYVEKVPIEQNVVVVERMPVEQKAPVVEKEKEKEKEPDVIETNAVVHTDLDIVIKDLPNTSAR